MDLTAEQISQLNETGLFLALWPKYEAEVHEKRMLETQHRDEAFVDVPRTVAGEEIRMMTARDFLIFDGLGSPFARIGNIVADADDCFFLLWHLNRENYGTGIANAFRRGRARARIYARDVAETAGAIDVYLDSVFIDIDRKKASQPEQRPASVSFLAELIVEVASAVGAHDPFSGALLADVPIPRLLQYQRAAHRIDNAKANDFTEFDSARSRCLEEVNRILAERRKR
jgi:hypothetical protein